MYTFTNTEELIYLNNLIPHSHAHSALKLRHTLKNNIHTYTHTWIDGMEWMNGRTDVKN